MPLRPALALPGGNPAARLVPNVRGPARSKQSNRSVRMVGIALTWRGAAGSVVGKGRVAGQLANE